MDEQHQYWAFLSYSHQDRRWAEWLHRALETYQIPRRLAGRPTPAGPAPRRFRPIFCDREELAANADLGERIGNALDRSAYLIVICSPAGARSPWVEKEILRFRVAHGEDRVFAVIVDGEPYAEDPQQECLPQALRAGSEPIAADLRPNGDGRKLARLKLIAGMLDVGLDELARRDAQRRQRQLTALTAASVIFALVMGGLTVAAVDGRNQARAQHAQAEGLVEFMLSDLRETLQPAGRLDALDAVGNRAIAYYASQNGRHDAESLGRRARVLHLLGDIREQRGDLAGALEAFEEAAASTEELLARKPDDAQRVFDHAQSVYWVGYMAWRRGVLDDARGRFVEYGRLADRLVEIEPGKDEWLTEVGYANSSLGTVLLEQGRADEAVTAFSRVHAINTARARKAPGERTPSIDLGQSYAWLADAEMARARSDLAAGYRASERRIYERLIVARPSDNEARQALAVNRAATAKILLTSKGPSAALPELTQASADLEALIAAEPDNVSYREKAVPVLVALGQARLQADDPRAGAAAQRALSLAEGLAAKDGAVAKWQGPLLGSARLLQARVAARNARDTAALREALAIAAAEAPRLARLLKAAPHDPALARLAAEAALLEGDYLHLTQHPAEAKAAWRRAQRMLDSGAARDDQALVIQANAAARLSPSSPFLEFGTVNPRLTTRRTELAGSLQPSEAP